MIPKLTQTLVQSGATWVLWLLLAISVLALAVVFERAVVLRKARSKVAELSMQLRTCLAQGGAPRGLAFLATVDVPGARVASAGLGVARQGPAAAEEAMAAAMGIERKALEAHLLFLGTVGNNAPFLGLLGTVIGVVGAFAELGRTSLVAQTTIPALAPEGVMASISEALVATAVGLLVAIPAVAAFNALQGKVGAVLADAEVLGHVALAHLKATTGADVETSFDGDTSSGTQAAA
jgi:biopolymer transport protein ExbB